MVGTITLLDSSHLASLPQHYATCTHTSAARTLTPNQGYVISDMLVHALPCISTATSWVPYAITGLGDK